uniref:Uncharacterized protein n=1 Tax=Chromera velia CCMP2878 TaxID=1169474 RepID=A0A0G4IFR1_9ALVE|eukprot:Cvel_14053.t1-p1 / transcript=Cvel_14053.t1 / gene=Cvel_14053 / organism=Chromera_velia_CCMP2878 / gene_product=hypothetical protein / transcript_product=hypothetical protein / location=Cvel_scaffold985:29714-55693(-) / protein_length=3818 / sequence_SO=supercontig / SO=protein_coding / is_pseudo=false
MKVKSFFWFGAFSSAWSGGLLAEGRGGIQTALMPDIEVLEPGQAERQGALSSLVEVHEDPSLSPAPSPAPPSLLEREGQQDEDAGRQFDRIESYHLDKYGNRVLDKVEYPNRSRQQILDQLDENDKFLADYEKRLNGHYTPTTTHKTPSRQIDYGARYASPTKTRDYTGSPTRTRRDAVFESTARATVRTSPGSTGTPIPRVTSCSEIYSTPNTAGVNYWKSAIEFTDKLTTSCPSASPMSLALAYSKEVAAKMARFENPSHKHSYEEQHKSLIEQGHEAFILNAVVQNLFWKAEADAFFSGSGELLKALLEVFGKTYTAAEFDVGPALSILSFFIKMRQELTKHQFAHADKIADFSNLKQTALSAFQKPTTQRLNFIESVSSTFALNKTPFCPRPASVSGLLPTVNEETVMKTYGNFNMDIYLDSIKFKDEEGKASDLGGMVYTQALEYHIGLLDQVVRTHEGSRYATDKGYVLPSKALPQSPVGSEILQNVPSLISRLTLAHGMAISLRLLQIYARSYGDTVVFPIGLAGGHLVRTLIAHGTLDSVAVAIGWTNPDGGHAMMMDVKKSPTKTKLYIEIDNTGGGSGIHGAAEHGIDSGDGRLNTLPYYRFKRVPMDEIMHTAIMDRVSDLTVVMPSGDASKGQKLNDAEAIYKVALDPLAEWRDYKHEAEAPESDFVRPQLSGTCTMKSPKVWMQRALEKKELWKELKKEMRPISTRHAINWVTAKVQVFEGGKGSPPDPLWARLLLEGSRDLIRFMNSQCVYMDRCVQIHEFPTAINLPSLPLDASIISSDESFLKMTDRATPAKFQELSEDNAVGAPPSFTLPVPRLWSSRHDADGSRTYAYIETLYKSEGRGLPVGSFTPKMRGDFITARLLALPVPSKLKDNKLFGNKGVWDRLPESEKDVWMQMPTRLIPSLIDMLYLLVTESLGEDKAMTGKPTERIVAVNLVLAIVWRLSQVYEIQEQPTGSPVVGQYCFHAAESLPFVDFAMKFHALTYDAFVQQKMKETVDFWRNDNAVMNGDCILHRRFYPTPTSMNDLKDRVMDTYRSSSAKPLPEGYLKSVADWLAQKGHKAPECEASLCNYRSEDTARTMGWLWSQKENSVLNAFPSSSYIRLVDLFSFTQSYMMREGKIQSKAWKAWGVGQLKFQRDVVDGSVCSPWVTYPGSASGVYYQGGANILDGWRDARGNVGDDEAPFMMVLQNEQARVDGSGENHLMLYTRDNPTQRLVTVPLMNPQTSFASLATLIQSKQLDFANSKHRNLVDFTLFGGTKQTDVLLKFARQKSFVVDEVFRAVDSWITEAEAEQDRAGSSLSQRHATGIIFGYSVLLRLADVVSQFPDRPIDFAKSSFTSARKVSNFVFSKLETALITEPAASYWTRSTKGKAAAALMTHFSRSAESFQITTKDVFKLLGVQAARLPPIPGTVDDFAFLDQQADSVAIWHAGSVMSVITSLQQSDLKAEMISLLKISAPGSEANARREELINQMTWECGKTSTVCRGVLQVSSSEKDVCDFQFYQPDLFCGTTRRDPKAANFPPSIMRVDLEGSSWFRTHMKGYAVESGKTSIDSVDPLTFTIYRNKWRDRKQMDRYGHAWRYMQLQFQKGLSAAPTAVRMKTRNTETEKKDAELLEMIDLDKPDNETLKYAPLPKTPQAEQYHFWRAVAGGRDNVLVATDKENGLEVLRVTKKSSEGLVAEFGDVDDPVVKRVFSPVEYADAFRAKPNFDFAAFEEWNGVSLFKSKPASREEKTCYRLVFYRYYDLTSGKSTGLSFSDCDSKTGALVWEQNPTYVLSNSQTLFGDQDGFHRFLVLKDTSKGDTVLLLPEKEAIFPSNDEKRRKNDPPFDQESKIAVHIVAAGKVVGPAKMGLQPADRKQRLISAYHMLKIGRYDSALNFLLEVSSLEKFSEEEGRLASLIFQDKDSMPKGLAIKFLTFLIAYQQSYFGHNDKNVFELCGMGGNSLSSVYRKYLDVHKNLPHRFRLVVSAAAPKDSTVMDDQMMLFLSPVQELELIDMLGDDDFLDSRRRALWGYLGQPNMAPNRVLSVGKTTTKMLDQKPIKVRTQDMLKKLKDCKDASSYKTPSGPAEYFYLTMNKAKLWQFSLGEDTWDGRKFCAVARSILNGNREEVEYLYKNVWVFDEMWTGEAVGGSGWADKAVTLAALFVKRLGPSVVNVDRTALDKINKFNEYVDTELTRYYMRVDDKDTYLEMPWPLAAEVRDYSRARVKGTSPEPSDEEKFQQYNTISDPSKTFERSGGHDVLLPSLSEKVLEDLRSADDNMISLYAKCFKADTVSGASGPDMSPLLIGSSDDFIQKNSEKVAQEANSGRTRLQKETAENTFTFLDRSCTPQLLGDSLSQYYKRVIDAIERNEQELQATWELGSMDEHAMAVDVFGLEDEKVDWRALLPVFLKQSKRVWRARLRHVLSNDVAATVAEKLHKLLFSRIFLETSLQHIDRAIGHFKSFKQSDRDTFVELGKTLRSARVQMDTLLAMPAIVVFEYAANLRLREDQALDMRRLLQPPPSGSSSDRPSDPVPMIIQRLMGGGKTFVLGTLLATCKADGYHLSVLMTPQVSQKHYLVVSPGTAHTIQNTFVEVMHELAHFQFPPASDHSEAAEKKVEELKKALQHRREVVIELAGILRLFRERGSGVFDEIDITFDPKTEHNFPLSHKSKPQTEMLDLIVHLYIFAGTDERVKNFIGVRSRSQVENFELYFEEKVQPELIKETARYIAEHPKWSKLVCVSKWKEFPECKKIVWAFLATPTFHKGKDTKEGKRQRKIANSIQKRHPDGLELLALAHMQLWSMFKGTWTKSVNLHFGRSKARPGFPLPVPYSAANTPNESSEFANRWEVINRACMTYLVGGLNGEQTRQWVIALQKQLVREEERETAGKDIPPAEYAEIRKNLDTQVFFREVVGAKDTDLHDLLRLDVYDDEVIERLRSKLEPHEGEGPKHVEAVMNYTRENVLPAVETASRQIIANPQNLGSMFQTVQGYSGTLENTFIFPYDIVQALDTFDTASDEARRRLTNEGIFLDKGANGKVLYRIIGSNPQISDVTDADPAAPVNPADALNKVSSEGGRGGRYRALIDIGALFKAYSNEATAREILGKGKGGSKKCYSCKGDGKISGVIYFDEMSNTLRVLLADEKTPREIFGTRPENIIAAVGSLEIYNSLFTYYDHRHITGVDIKQRPEALALATSSSDTPLRDILQGVMRMRQYLSSQLIDFAVAGTTFVASLKNKSTNALDVYLLLQKAQILQFEWQRLQNRQVATQMLSDVVRQEILDSVVRKVADCMWAGGASTLTPPASSRKGEDPPVAVCTANPIEIFRVATPDPDDSKDSDTSSTASTAASEEDTVHMNLFVRALKENYRIEFLMSQTREKFTKYLGDFSTRLMNVYEATISRSSPRAKKTEMTEKMQKMVAMFPMKNDEVDTAGGSDLPEGVEVQMETEVEVEVEVEVQQNLYPAGTVARKPTWTIDTVRDLNKYGTSAMARETQTKSTAQALRTAIAKAVDWMLPSGGQAGGASATTGKFWGDAFALPLLPAPSRLDIHVQQEFVKTVDVPLAPDRLDLLGEFRKTPWLITALTSPSSSGGSPTRRLRGSSGFSSSSSSVEGAMLLSSSDLATMIDINQDKLGVGYWDPPVKSNAHPIVLGTCSPSSIYLDEYKDSRNRVTPLDIASFMISPEDLFSLRMRLMQVIVLLYDGRMGTLDKREWHYLVKILISVAPELASKFHRYVREGIVYLSEDRRLQMRSSRTLKLLQKTADLSSDPLKFDEEDVKGEEETRRQMVVYTNRFFGKSRAVELDEKTPSVVREGHLPNVTPEMLS